MWTATAGAPHFPGGAAFPSYGDNSHTYVSAYPIIQGFALLGELAKYVSLAEGRFSNITTTSAGVSVTVHGVEGEKVEVTALVPGPKGEAATVARVVKIAFTGSTHSRTVHFTAVP